MLRLLKLELGKIFKPVITTTAILTVLTCILTCVLQRDYTVYFHIDAWEIGTEYIALLFPLFVRYQCVGSSIMNGATALLFIHFLEFQSKSI